MNEAVIFYGNKKKAIFWVVFALVFIAFGFWILDSELIGGVICIVTPCLIIPESMAMMIPKKYFLRIDHEGLAFGPWSGNKKFSWKEIEGFCIADIGGRKVIKVIGTNTPGLRRKEKFKVPLKNLESQMNIQNHYEAPLAAILYALNTWQATHKK